MHEHATEPKAKKDKFLPLSILAAAAMITIAIFYNAGKKAELAAQQANVGDAAQQIAKMPEVSADDPQIGKADAPVTIVMFSDPSCPFCAAAAGGNEEVMRYLRSNDPAWEPSVPNIVKDYVSAGKVRIAYKYFPGHGKGIAAMQLLYCANEQGKFWETHDAFEKNQGLMESGDTAGLAKLAASVSGVAEKDLQACLASGKYAAKMKQTTQEGAQARVEGTPAFYVNGQVVSGAVPYASFKPVIDAALGEK